VTDVIVLIPVLGRPHRVEPLLESLIQSQGRAVIRPLFIVSPNDVDEIRAVAASGADFEVVPWDPGPGDFARKINYGMISTLDPWIFTGADDLKFHAGWADAAIACAGDSYGVVGTNDLGNATVMRGDHATHLLIRREYAIAGTIDEPAKIFHEGYDHQWVDAELVATAKARGQWVFCRGSIVEHLHPFWGKAERDATYEKALAHGAADRVLFNRRSRLWA
jgi:hypothetical protein